MIVASIIGLTTLIIIYAATRKSVLQVPLTLKTKYTTKKERIEYFTYSSRKALIEAFILAQNRVFGLETSQGTTCVLQRDHLNSLKSHKALSFEATVSDFAQKSYTLVGGIPDYAINAMVAKFNPTLTEFTPLVHDMIRRHWPETFNPQAHGWRAVSPYQDSLNVVAQLSARLLISEEASNNQEWLRLSTNYVAQIVDYIVRLKSWPEFLRPLVWRLVPGCSSMLHQQKQARALIAQTLTDKQKRIGSYRSNSPPTLLDHILTGKEFPGSLDEQVGLQLSLVVAAVHTTSAMITQSLFDLAVSRQYVPELRQEAQSVLNGCGGTFTRAGLAKLEKLDSFIKEVARLNSPDLTTFQRKTLTALQLSNDLLIPAGTRLELPTAALNVDSQLWGPDASKFQPLRFYNMRYAESGNEAKHVFVSVNTRELSWGYGRHACPGRWLSDIEIKVFLAEFLLRCDIKNPLNTKRWESDAIDGQVLPNSKGVILIAKAP